MNRITYIIILLLVSMTGAAFGQGVYFQLKNEQLKGDTYEFDVYMGADELDTYHTRGMVYVTYNLNAFGADVVLNKKVTVTPLQLLTETEALTGGPKYQTVNVTDNGNRLVITWQAKFLNLAPTAASHTLVPIKQVPLYHVQVLMEDVTQAPNLSLDYRLMHKQQYYALAGADKEHVYDVGIAITEKLTFTAVKANEHDVLLKWETSAEANNDHYVVEKKRGNGSYEALTKVDAVGNTIERTKYEYTDRSGMANVNTFRIKQVDTDGTVVYSNEIEISFDFYENDKFVVYPVPARTSTTLKATGPLDADYRFSISDLTGRTLFNGFLDQNAPNSAIKIDLTDYAEGTYYVITTSPDGKRYLNRIVKAD